VRRFLPVLFSIVVFAVFAELLCLAIYFFQTGHLFYASRRNYAVVRGDLQERTLVSVGLHPYFGPTHKAGHPFNVPASLRPDAPGALHVTNNFGFVSPHDYPFERQGTGQFIVGIFGGSVALWFCEVGVERLIDGLMQHATFKGRTVVPLCFSHEGYKQPQQLQVLAYFLSIGQELDLVLNIDGFNEVALSSLGPPRGLDISMPSSMHIEPMVDLINQATLSSERLETLAAISRDRRQINALVARLRRNRLASINFVLELLHQRASMRHAEAAAALARLPPTPPRNSLIQLTPPVAARDEAALFDEIAKQWARASRSMSDLLAARSIPYFHVLQPNQYFATGRTFSTAEARVAFHPESPFRNGVQKGYPRLLRESGALTPPRMYFLNAVELFDAEPSAAYMDDCCHYTRAGYDRLADFIARGVLAAGPRVAAAP
jgi:hypothetical protein